MTSNKNIKKRKAVCIHTFLRGIRISSQILKILIMKFWLSYTWPRPLTLLAWAKNFEKCIFFCFTSLSMEFGIGWCTGRFPISKSCGKKWVYWLLRNNFLKIENFWHAQNGSKWPKMAKIRPLYLIFWYFMTDNV